MNRNAATNSIGGMETTQGWPSGSRTPSGRGSEAAAAAAAARDAPLLELSPLPSEYKP